MTRREHDLVARLNPAPPDGPSQPSRSNDADAHRRKGTSPARYKERPSSKRAEYTERCSTLDGHVFTPFGERVFYEWTFASVAVAARDASFRSCVRANHRASASQMSDSGTAMTETWARLTPRPISPA